MARRLLSLTLAALALSSSLALAGGGSMRSTVLGPRLCETAGGGRFVDIPGFPGEQIDRRLLADVRYLVKRYRIFVTDGYSTSDVHAWNGEHPIGLALDIVPNKAAGGSWRAIDRLARWAEPRQDRPREPFRWVGYDGDSGHGRGHHLHLSWNHTMTKPKRPAPSVYTMLCPGSDSPGLTPDPTQPQPEPKPPSGGVGGRKFPPVVVETGGVRYPGRGR